MVEQFLIRFHKQDFSFGPLIRCTFFQNTSQNCPSEVLPGKNSHPMISQWEHCLASVSSQTCVPGPGLCFCNLSLLDYGLGSDVTFISRAPSCLSLPGPILGCLSCLSRHVPYLTFFSQAPAPVPDANSYDMTPARHELPPAPLADQNNYGQFLCYGSLSC